MKWVDLSSRAKFRLTGEDRVRYLNGQVSNQVAQDLSSKAVQACVCTLKGKIEALVSITAEGDSLLVDCDAELREALFTRLDRYLIADDCEIEDVTEEYQLWHGLGEGGEGVESDRYGETGCDVWLKSGEAADFAGEVVSEESLEILRIKRGIPKWGHELRGDEFPAEVRLDERAVSFNKGCYLGQEVVSRIKSAGKVNKRLVGLESVGAGFSLKEGDPLVVEDKEAGVVTSVASCGERVLALAVVKRAFTEAAEAGKLPEELSMFDFERGGP